MSGKTKAPTTVWVVQYGDARDWDLVGVFTSEQKADDYVSRMPECDRDGYSIESVELDKAKP